MIRFMGCSRLLGAGSAALAAKSPLTTTSSTALVSLGARSLSGSAGGGPRAARPECLQPGPARAVRSSGMHAPVPVSCWPRAASSYGGLTAHPTHSQIQRSGIKITGHSADVPGAALASAAIWLLTCGRSRRALWPDQIMIAAGHEPCASSPECCRHTAGGGCRGGRHPPTAAAAAASGASVLPCTRRV